MPTDAPKLGTSSEAIGFARPQNAVAIRAATPTGYALKSRVRRSLRRRLPAALFRTWKVPLQKPDSAAALLFEIGPITNPTRLDAGCHGDWAIIPADFLQREVAPCVGHGGDVTITAARWVEFRGKQLFVTEISTWLEWHMFSWRFG